MLHQCPVPVTLDEKQQYLIVHAELMALKLMVQEELVNLTGESKKGKGTVILLQALCGPEFQWRNNSTLP